jgi:tRNA A37 threonylcarbamoyladenosine synthetase subunit TsaC/SUA5/YrdC
MTEHGRRILRDHLNADGTIGGRIPDSPVELQLSAELGSPLTTTALRDDRGDLVHDVQDACEILESRLDAVQDQLAYLPLLTMISARGFTHNEHSTVIALDAAETKITPVRCGAMPFKRVLTESRRLGPMDVPDGWT